MCCLSAKKKTASFSDGLFVIDEACLGRCWVDCNRIDIVQGRAYFSKGRCFVVNLSHRLYH